MISDHYSLTNPRPTPGLTVMAPLSSSVLPPFIPPCLQSSQRTAVDCLTSPLRTPTPDPIKETAASQIFNGRRVTVPPPQKKTQPAFGRFRPPRRPEVPPFELEKRYARARRGRCCVFKRGGGCGGCSSTWSTPARPPCPLTAQAMRPQNPPVPPPEPPESCSDSRATRHTNSHQTEGRGGLI